MKLQYFRGNPPNFGDELNATMWDHLLPRGFLDDDPSDLFVGIGSIIQHDYPASSRKFVVGSGYGGYTQMPDVHDGSWEFAFVRGPQTAEVLGLDPSLAITDAAVMLRATPLPLPAAGIGAAFMPHYESMSRGDWEPVCRMAGIHLIDPRRPVDEILAEIRGARLLIAEAMHGAIVADALRTPWIAVRALAPLHRFKWHDWARSLGLEHRPAPLLPSHGREAWAFATGRSGIGRGAQAVFGGMIAAPFNAALRAAAARGLARLALREGQLSPDAVLETVTDRALSALERLVRSRRPAGSDWRGSWAVRA